MAQKELQLAVLPVISTTLTDGKYIKPIITGTTLFMVFFVIFGSYHSDSILTNKLNLTKGCCDKN